MDQYNDLVHLKSIISIEPAIANLFEWASVYVCCSEQVQKETDHD